MTEKPCQLYKHYDADGELLYVGISLSAIVRLAQHKKHAAWAHLIARVDVRTYPSLKAARKAERWAIENYAPRFNQRMAIPLMSSTDLGRRLNWTLAKAYQFAREKGDLLTTIDPVEFATMTEKERRHHRRMLKRAAMESGLPRPTMLSIDEIAPIKPRQNSR